MNLFIIQMPVLNFFYFFYSLFCKQIPGKKPFLPVCLALAAHPVHLTSFPTRYKTLFLN